MLHFRRSLQFINCFTDSNERRIYHWMLYVCFDVGRVFATPTAILSARWDATRKMWFVPEGLDVNAFKRWLPQEPNISLRSESYFIA
jgi:hypothetical protein